MIDSNSRKLRLNGYITIPINEDELVTLNYLITKILN